jgi:hypothetical protein
MPKSMSIFEYFIKCIINIYYQINNKLELVIPIHRPHHYNMVKSTDRLVLSLLKLYNNTMADCISIFIIYDNTVPKSTFTTTAEMLIKNIILSYQEINKYLQCIEKVVIL